MPDRILYHYTNAAGLLGMVKDRKLWATESNFLNDPAEVAFGSRFVFEELRRRRDAGTILLEDQRLNELLELLERSYLDPHSVAQYKEDRPFVTSFSEQPDILSLWRNYSGRNGFCLGFSSEQILGQFGMGYPSQEDYARASGPDAERIRDAWTNSALQARIADISYGEASLISLVDDLLATASQQDEFVREPAVRAVLRRLAEVKHEGFAEEREVRLIVQETGDLSPGRHVRVSPSIGLVSYHPIAFGFEALRSITIAPGSNFAQARSALNSLMFLGARGAWAHVHVADCEIPFVW